MFEALLGRPLVQLVRTLPSDPGAPSVQVLGQQRHPGEGLAAVGAGVLLHVGMCLQMGSQVGAISEGSVTQRARERLLSCVCSDVSLQQPGSGERLSTQNTLAGQCVRPDVHLECA